MAHRIAVIGAGNVGRALAFGLAGAGHDIVVGVRRPDDAKHAALAEAETVALSPTGTASAEADVIILAVPAPSLAELVSTLGLRSGQIVVDATNAVRTPVPGGATTVADHVVALVPEGVAVVKAFNTIGAEHLGDGRFEEGEAFLPIAGDDEGRAVVGALAAELGFEVADLGGRDAFELVEAHARLWIHLAFARGWGRGFGFRVVGR
ncbi:MAG: NAD(P)-binding domain-containing protein [Actinomycetota bacterium]